MTGSGDMNGICAWGECNEENAANPPKSVAMKILEIFIVLGANCKFIDAFYGILIVISQSDIDLNPAGRGYQNNYIG